jgi:hypothetical protein
LLPSRSKLAPDFFDGDLINVKVLRIDQRANQQSKEPHSGTNEVLFSSAFFLGERGFTLDFGPQAARGGRQVKPEQRTSRLRCGLRGYFARFLLPGLLLSTGLAGLLRAYQLPVRQQQANWELLNWELHHQHCSHRILLTALLRQHLLGFLACLLCEILRLALEPTLPSTALTAEQSRNFGTDVGDEIDRARHQEETCK